MKLDTPIIHEAAMRAVAEDCYPMDVTSQIFIEEGATASALLFPKEKGVLSGGALAEEVFRQVDPHLHIEKLQEDGTELVPSEPVLRVKGSARSILTGERSALNFLQRLSGVATLTQLFVQEVSSTHAQILDTRKTTPGIRAVEKYAVKCGGGENHRFGLYDRFLIKENHLQFLGDEDLGSKIKEARLLHPELLIEIEAETLEEVRRFSSLDTDIILLDNMEIKQLCDAVKIIDGKVKTEASGGITLENAKAIAESGVDYLSIGGLTHSPRAIDFSLDIQKGS